MEIVIAAGLGFAAGAGTMFLVMHYTIGRITKKYAVIIPYTENTDSTDEHAVPFTEPHELYEIPSFLRRQAD